MKGFIFCCIASHTEADSSEYFFFNTMFEMHFHFYSSGVEEEYGEKDMILQDLQDLLDEEEKQREKEKMEKSQEESKAIDVCKRALETLRRKEQKQVLLLYDLKIFQHKNRNYVLYLH